MEKVNQKPKIKEFIPSIPEWWIDAASLEARDCNSLGAVRIGLAVWKQSKMRKRVTNIRLPTALLRKKGFGHHYISNGLKTLEIAGLVTVKRYPHKSPVISLITDEAMAAKLRENFGLPVKAKPGGDVSERIVEGLQRH